MAKRGRLRTLACCAILEMAALAGMPMRAEDIQELMRALNEPKIAHTTPDEDDRGDAPEAARARSLASPGT